MKHAGTAFLVVMLFSTLGLWGIAQQKNGANASRLRDLEARHVKFEEEQRAFAQQSDRNHRRIATLEVEKAELTQAVEELKVAVAERDDLRKQVTVRTSERNDLRAQLEVGQMQERDAKALELKQFSQELQALLGRMESSVANAAPRTAAPVEAVPVFRRSE